jgi:hypothetical protein
MDDRDEHSNTPGEPGDDRFASFKREVSEESRQLLAALEEIRETEAEKRRQPISSPRFHELADRVEEKAREVFRLSERQRRAGEAAPRSDTSIDDILRGDPPGASSDRPSMPSDEELETGEAS